MTRERKLEPIRPRSFSLDTGHAGFRTFSVHLPAEVKKEDITNPDLYVHIGPQLQTGWEIRLLHEEMEFYARVLVTFVQGSVVRVFPLEVKDIDTAEILDEDDDFFIKLRGPRKWCLIKRSTGEVLREMIPDKSTAMRELSDYRKALAA